MPEDAVFTEDSASSATSDSVITFSNKAEEIKHILTEVNPQVILYGPPGTSKTYTALEVVKNFTEGEDTETAVGQREILLFAAKWSETKHGKGYDYYFEISKTMIDGGFFNKIGFQESVHNATNKKIFKAKFFDDDVVELDIHNPTGSGKCRIPIKGKYKQRDSKFREGVLSNGYPKAADKFKKAQREKNYNLNEDVTVFVLEWIDAEDGPILSIAYVNPGNDLFENYSNFIQNRHGESFAPNNNQERYWRIIRPLGNKKTPIQDRKVVWDIVQFHPNYNYEDFVRGIRPRTIDGILEFREEDGPLLRMAKSAEDHPDVPHILIVDEINRAILSRVFGEAFNLLENRGEEMEISGGGTMRLPTNLYLIGTMNTADRNISTFDHALRRRFTMIPLNPSAVALSSRLQECEVTGESLTLITTMFNKVQDLFQSQNSSLAVGHTYFMVKPKKRIPIQLETEETDSSSYESMTVAKLKEELKRRGLPSSGKKADLAARLLENDDDTKTSDDDDGEDEASMEIEAQERPLEQFASNFITKIAPLLEEYRLEGVVNWSNLSELAKHIEDVLENWRVDSTSNVFDQIQAWCTAMKEDRPPPPNGHPEGLVAALVEELRKGNRQLILAGPPGTSKTYSATVFWDKLTDEIINDSNQYSGMEAPDRGLSQWKFSTSNTILQKKISEKGRARDVQFHPSYGYEDFVRGIEVVGGGSIPTFNEVEKVFIETVKESLANPSKLYLLRIDEINRALLSRVLGELILGLEYRNLSITLPGSQGTMSIPENLLIIGTMNTSDRNLSTVDHAIRRRFTFIHAPANPDVVRDYHGEGHEQYYNCYLKLIEAMEQDDSFQAGVLIQDLLIGHTYFLTENEGEFFHNLVYQVLPLIEEYHEEGVLTKEGKGRLAKVISDHLPNFSESSALWRGEIKAWCEERMPKDQSVEE